MRALIAICVVVTAGCQCGPRLVDVPDGLVVTPASVDFGAVKPGEAVPRTVTLRNDGKRALALTLNVESDARSTFAVAPVKLTLALGDERTIDLEYVGAQVSGIDTATLVIAEGAREANVPLRGETIVDVITIIETPDSGTTNPDAGGVDAGVPDAGTCVPRTCAQAARVCGSLDDGCGGTLACGTCGGGTACSAAGQCVCSSPNTTELSCGNGTDDDCDGRIDCVDSDCVGATACAPVMCSNQGDLRVSTGVLDSNAPDLAFDGTNFGIAWLRFDSMTSGIDFSFARMSLQQQLVGAPVELTNDGFGAHPPRLAWSGEWAIGASTLTQTMNGPANTVRVRRFDDQGTTVGAPIDFGPGWPATVASGPMNGQLGLLWGNGAVSSNVPTLSLVAQGAANGPNRPLMSGEGADYGDLVWDGSGWAMVWTATQPQPNPGSGVRFARLDAQGSVTIAPVLIAPSNAFSPRLAVTASQHYGIVWQQYGAQNRFDIYFTRLDSSGATITAPVNLSNSSGNAMLADITWTGAAFAAVWTEDLGSPAPTKVWLARLDPSGQATAPTELVSCGSAAAWRPAIHFAAGKLAVAWGDSRVPGHLEVYARVLNP
ncbi:MAG: hypothetical protein JNM17_15800 [Archangium sp.]|nr:hypothetical protein [Archangium sp.]